MAQGTQFCDQCGTAIRAIARFCTNCGERIQINLSPEQGTNEVQRALDVIICYAHEDERLRDRLVKQLYVLERQGSIKLWHDRHISAGKEWIHEIDTNLNKAHIILLLVSADFIASDYCYSTEMQRAIERHEEGEARVIPIILRHVHWQSTPLGKLQALPTDAQPVMASNWQNLDEAFFNVAEEIRMVVEGFLLPTKGSDKGPLPKTRNDTNGSNRNAVIRPDKRIGTLVGNYHLIRKLGAGGFGEVYLGNHIHLGTQAAVKLMLGALMGQSAEEFLHDAQHIARLTHPHIARIFDFGIQEYIPFLVMDYASNGTLRQRYPKGHRLSLSTIIHYINQITDALQYAHERRYIHGDLKPENLLLGQRSEVLLSDFSLVVDTSSVVDPMDGMSGTIPYMAPEQLHGQRLRASDQYALGVIVYEWLCGSRPFSGSPYEILTQHLVARPPAIHDRVTIPLPVEAVIMKALAKDPERRFGTVRDFAVALEQASTTGT